MTGCVGVAVLSLIVGAVAGIAIMCLMTVNNDEPNE